MACSAGRSRMIGVLALVAATVGLPSCTDNATDLASDVRRASARLRDRPDGAEGSFTYRPRPSSPEPYTVIFLPARPTTRDDLVAVGVTETLAARVFDELAYVNVDRGRLLVVHRPGVPLAFTTTWTAYASVERPLAATAADEIEVVLRKVDGRVQVVEIRE